MKKLFLICFCSFMAMHSASIAQVTDKYSSSREKKIMNVTRMEFEVVKNHGEELVVWAYGETNTAGWTNAMLKPKFSVDKRKTGVYEFDFVALPPAPGKNTLQVVSPVKGEYVFKTIPNDFKTAVVYSENNNIEKDFATAQVPTSMKVSCDDKRPGVLVFNTSGDYKVSISHIEMGNIKEADLCFNGMDVCWDNLQTYSEGSARTFKDVKAGSTLAVTSSGDHNKIMQKLIMDNTSCPPKEGYLFFSNNNGFRLTLKIDSVEGGQTTMNE
jgi:hypothetical protein